MTEERAKVQFQLPLDVRDWFKALSNENCRSMNKQFIAMARELMKKEEKECVNAQESA